MSYVLTSTASSTSANGYGYSVATAEKAAEPFTTSTAGTLDSVTFSMCKIGAPGDNFVIEVQTDSAGSPSGTVIASYTGAGSSITTSPTDYSYSFGITTLSATTTYWFVFKRSGALSTSDYYTNPGLSSGSNFKWLNSSVWTSTPGTQRYTFTVSDIVGGSSKRKTLLGVGN